MCDQDIQARRARDLQWNKSPRPATEFQNAGDLMFLFMRPAPLPESG